MKKIVVIFTAFLFALVVGIVGTKGASGATAPGQVPLYRLYNPNSGEHFYTTSYTEATADYNAGWNIEGTGWTAPASGSPVYRLYNPNAGDHMFTAGSNEKDTLVAAGWKYEGIGWYSGGSVPLFRDYNPNATTGAHNYTTSQYEAQSLVHAGWKNEGIAWYALGPGNSNGAMTHSSATNNDSSRSTAAPRKVDIGSSDIPDASYRTLYPNNAWPQSDQVSVPGGSPTAVYSGTVSTNDAYSADGGAKYALTTVGGTKAGLVGVGFQHVNNASDTDFGGGQVSMVLFNYKAGATNGGQYYVTVSNGVNQTGTNSFEVDYYANAHVVVYKLNGNVVVALKTQINYNQLYSFQTAYASASDSFTARAFGSSQSWKGERAPVDIRG